MNEEDEKLKRMMNEESYKYDFKYIKRNFPTQDAELP